MLACEMLMNTEVALTVQMIVERATGEPCPCKQGQPCPLFSSQIEPPALADAL